MRFWASWSGRYWEVVSRRANLSPAALAAGRRTSILTDSHEFPSVCASVAQLAEQLICNQQVVGSSPSASSSSEREREVRRANGFRIGRVCGELWSVPREWPWRSASG